MKKLITLPPYINTHWSAIAPLLTIRNEDEYEQAIERLNNLRYLRRNPSGKQATRSHRNSRMRESPKV